MCVHRSTARNPFSKNTFQRTESHEGQSNNRRKKATIEYIQIHGRRKSKQTQSCEPYRHLDDVVRTVVESVERDLKPSAACAKRLPYDNDASKCSQSLDRSVNIKWKCSYVHTWRCCVGSTRSVGRVRCHSVFKGAHMRKICVAPARMPPLPEALLRVLLHVYGVCVNLYYLHDRTRHGARSVHV